MSDRVRPIVITINPRPTQVQFAQAMKTKLPRLEIQRIRELPNSLDYFMQPGKKAVRDSIMSSISLQQVFPNAIVDAIENSVLYPPAYPKAEQLNQLNEVLVQIEQSSLQKS